MDATALRLTPESQLVVWCAGLPAREPGRGPDRPPLGRPLDWTIALGLAQRHGVLALLRDRLRDVPDASVPARVTDALEGRGHRQARRNERRLAVLRQLVAAFAAPGIDVIPLTPLREASWRQIVQLELLVRWRDVAAATEVLAKAGVEPETRLTAEETFALLRAHGARRFVHPDGHVVSLQWDVEDRAVVHGPPVADLWRRATPGPEAWSLAPADRLLLQCVRGTVKRWHRLAWVREVAELLATAGPREAEEALARATRHGARRALALGTSLAVELLGAPAPGTLAGAIAEPAVGELRRGILGDLAAVTRPLPGAWRIARFQLQGRERLRDRIGYGLRRAMLPRPEDVAALRLPQRLFFLLYAACPALRARRAAVGFVRRVRRYGAGKIARFGRTPAVVVDRMMALAGATAADTVYDLGCGDGGILVRAARRIGCRGVGIDLDPELLEAARANARAAGVDGLVEFVHGDARELDLTGATVVSLYLNAAANLTLRPTLERALRPGTRVVSFNFDMGDWWPDDVDVVDETSWGSNTVYLWRIPPPATTADSAA